MHGKIVRNSFFITTSLRANVPHVSKIGLFSKTLNLPTQKCTCITDRIKILLFLAFSSTNFRNISFYRKTEDLRRHAEEMLEYFGFGSIRNQHSSKPFNLLSDHLALLHENTTRPNLEYYKYQRDLYRMFCARGNYYSLECDGSMGSY